MTLKEKIARILSDGWVDKDIAENLSKIIIWSVKSEMKKCVPEKKKERKNKYLTYVNKVNCGIRNFNACRQQTLKRIEEIQ